MVMLQWPSWLSSGTACPVVFEEEVEMMCLWIEYVVGKDIDEIAQGTLESLVLPDAEEVGVRLYDVQVGVLRLREVGVKLGEAHVVNLAPLPRASLYISVIHHVE